MILSQFLLILTEGLIFSIFAYGVFLSFQWLRFPDLTPDGSFILGGCLYAKLTMTGMSPLTALILSFLGGMLCGICTGSLNKIVKIPPVISGLIMSIALYSIGWVILGKPNQFLENSQTLVGSSSGDRYNAALLFYVAAILTFITLGISFFSETIWGIKVKAIGENPSLAKNITQNETAYHLLLLGLANGLVSVAGALFLQRSFSADVNMGVGQTIIGLTGMMIGLLLVRTSRKTHLTLSCIVIGMILYKLVMFITLELGLPAELFRLASSMILVLLFLLMKTSRANLLKGIRWN